MKNSRSTQVLLVIAGIIGIGIGGALLFIPIEFEASAGILIEPNSSSLLSEIRAQGGTLITGGVIILLGAFMTKLTLLSLILSSVYYLSYGFSRILSIIIDGLPQSSLVTATILELVIGAISLFMLYQYQKNYPKRKTS